MALLLETPSNEYLLDASIGDLVKQAEDWKAETLFWREELKLFQRLLDHYNKKVESLEQKKHISHIQSMVTYYGGEVVYQLKHDISRHRKFLLKLDGKKSVADETYRDKHRKYGEQLVTFSKELTEIRKKLFDFIEQLA